MPIKSRRYHKRNKSGRTIKNKITRRYKKQMRGGNGLITSEEQLIKSWKTPSVKYWLVNDGQGFMTNIFREDASTHKIMEYEDFKGKINWYLTKIQQGIDGAYIKEIY